MFLNTPPLGWNTWNTFGENINAPMYEIQGQDVQGKEYMEFYVDEEKLQQLILELFYSPVNQ